jgi:hypothetical protein
MGMIRFDDPNAFDDPDAAGMGKTRLAYEYALTNGRVGEIVDVARAAQQLEAARLAPAHGSQV